MVMDPKLPFSAHPHTHLSSALQWDNLKSASVFAKRRVRPRCRFRLAPIQMFDFFPVPWPCSVSLFLYILSIAFSLSVWINYRSLFEFRIVKWREKWRRGPDAYARLLTPTPVLVPPKYEFNYQSIFFYAWNILCSNSGLFIWPYNSFLIIVIC